MNFVWNDVSLIAQDNSNACWYASAKMLVGWRHQRGQGAVDPDDLDNEARLHRSSNALPWEVMRRFAFELGLVGVPTSAPVPYPHQLENWLRSYGPLWTDGVAVDWNGNQAGSGHVVVVAGVSHSDEPDRVYVLDPWPVNRGHEGWRPFEHLQTILTARHNPLRQVSFLHYPASR